MVFEDYLNMEKLFLNDIASGNEWIMFGFMFVMLLYFSAKFNFRTQVTMIMVGLLGLLMGVISKQILIATIFILGVVFIGLLYKAILKQEG